MRWKHFREWYARDIPPGWDETVYNGDIIIVFATKPCPYPVPK
jgi:hypothetical protein